MSETNTSMTAKDREIIRDLARQVAELAARPIEQEKRDLWYKHNALESTRPVIFCDPEHGWHEIILQESLICESEEARGLEWRLRQEIFWGAEMNDDRVINPTWEVGYAACDTGWGLEDKKIGAEDGHAYRWDAPIKDYDQDLPKLHFPEITVDQEATKRGFDHMNDLFGDILPIRLRSGWWWSVGMTWQFVQLRGLDQMMMDMFDNPEGVHKLMAFLRDGTMAKIDYLESNGLLSLNNEGDYVGSGGFGWTHELPQPDFQGKVRCKDMWGFGESQETVGVSPDMFEEFVYQYQLPLLKRFGLNCYGCCEPLDKRWHVVKNVPNLRRVSVSAWADLEKMAENLNGDYIFSYKPNPADLATPKFDEDRIRRDLRRAMEITKGCRLEVIMKDCHTLAKTPTHATRWTQIAKEEAERVA